MKKLIPLVLGCSLLAMPAAFAQATAGGPSLPRRPNDTPPTVPEVRFDLDFPGGTPAALVKAIEKSAGKPLNAIVPVEYANEQLPPLRMKSVTVKDLFEALQQSSSTIVRNRDRSQIGGITQFTISYGFQTRGAPDYESIWYFYKNAPTEPVEPVQPKFCRFYNLAPYLEAYKVEDITTAVQTGWKMLGETSPPVMNYHKDTKLLIVVGENAKLGLIDTVLSELAKKSTATARMPSAFPPQAQPTFTVPPQAQPDAK